MKKTYLQRAKFWVETAEDVDIDSLQAAFCRIQIELKKKQANSAVGQEIVNDLLQTLSYLEATLEEFVGMNELPNKKSETRKELHEKEFETVSNYVLDSSPLFNINEIPEAISAEEKAIALAEVKQMPGIVSCGDLLSCNKNKTIVKIGIE